MGVTFISLHLCLGPMLLTFASSVGPDICLMLQSSGSALCVAIKYRLFGNVDMCRLKMAHSNMTKTSKWRVTGPMCIHSYLVERDL